MGADFRLVDPNLSVPNGIKHRRRIHSSTYIQWSQVWKILGWRRHDHPQPSAFRVGSAIRRDDTSREPTIDCGDTKKVLLRTKYEYSVFITDIIRAFYLFLHHRIFV